MSTNSPSQGLVAVIFDWAGTMVDFGSEAPVRGLQKVFMENGCDVEESLVREDMGLAKPDHIRKLLEYPSVTEQWRRLHGSIPTEGDVARMVDMLEATLAETLPTFSTPVPGAVTLVEWLRERGIKCGSTTGYSAKMMTSVTETARRHGYSPDTVVTADEVPQGRPWPWMSYLAAIRMEVGPFWRMLKVGDTRTDIEEGKNAGMWTAGVLDGGSELGLSQQQLTTLAPAELSERRHRARERFESVGADYVFDSIGGVKQAVLDIERRLRKGERPNA